MFKKYNMLLLSIVPYFLFWLNSVSFDQHLPKYPVPYPVPQNSENYCPLYFYKFTFLDSAYKGRHVIIVFLYFI